MPLTESTIVAAFSSSSDAQAAIRDLQAAGFRREDIYVEPDTETTSSRGEVAGTRREGGVTGWFKSLFTDESDTERRNYERAVGGGQYIVAVDVANDQFDAVADIFERHNSIDVHREDATATSQTGYAQTDAAGAPLTDRSQATAAGTAGTYASTGAAGSVAGTTRGTAGTGDAIPVVEEDLKVGKRRVLRGGVRAYSRVVERPVEETIGLAQERVQVDRRPVDRAATEADLQAGRDQVIEVDEYAEEPVVSKEARVVEEVRIGKERTQDSQTIRDSVRHTEVNLEQKPGERTSTGGAYGAYDTDFRNDFQTRYGSTAGSEYDTYAPSYRYGSEMANDPRYKGRSFNEIEPTLRQEYSTRYPNSTWDKMKDSVRYGWDRVTGKAAGKSA